MPTMDLATLRVRLTADTKDYQNEVEQAKGQSRQFGLDLKALVGGAAVAAFALAADAARQFAVDSLEEYKAFDKGVREVFTLLPNASAEAKDAMIADMAAFGVEAGRLTDETIPALYQAISAGVPSDNVLDFMGTAADAALGGVTELETAVDGISSVVNAYGAEAISAQEASDLMFTAVKGGKTTFGELAGSLFQVIPTAAATGVEFGNITAALATMTAQGTPTSVATTQLRQLLVELNKEGSKTSDVFEEVAGQSFREFMAQGGNLQQALQLMEGAAADGNVQLSDLFGSVEAGNAALSLTGAGTGKFTQELEAAEGAAGATAAAADTMAGSLTHLEGQAAAATEQLKIQVGEGLAPANREWLEAKVAVASAAAEMIAASRDINEINAVGEDLRGTLQELIAQNDGLSSSFDGSTDTASVMSNVMRHLTTDLDNWTGNADQAELRALRLEAANELLAGGFEGTGEALAEMAIRQVDAAQAQEAATMRAEALNAAYGDLVGVTEDNSEAAARLANNEREVFLALNLTEQQAMAAAGTTLALAEASEEATAAAERAAAAHEAAAETVAASMQTIDGEIENLFEAYGELDGAQAALAASPWSAEMADAVDAAEGRIDESLAAIAESHRQMVADMFVQNANMSGGFNQSQANIAVALGLMTADEAAFRLETQRTKDEVEFLGEKLLATFMEDGTVSRQEAALLEQAIAGIENGTITANGAFVALVNGGLAAYLEQAGNAQGETDTLKGKLLDLDGTYDVAVQTDYQSVIDATNAVNGIPTQKTVTVDVQYNDPGYVPPGVPGVPLQAGGYTGDMPVNQAAGIVHGQEFVFSAPAVAAIGLPQLEMMHAAARGGEAVYPGGGDSWVIQVDARGAAAGVEQRVRQVVRQELEKAGMRAEAIRRTRG